MHAWGKEESLKDVICLRHNLVLAQNRVEGMVEDFAESASG